MHATTTAVEFAEGARALSRAARARGLGVPSFRSPPRIPAVDRSIRRRGEYAVVAVRTRGRPWVAVAADMIEGVIVANGMAGGDAVRIRGALWAALGFASASDDASRAA